MLTVAAFVLLKNDNLTRFLTRVREHGWHCKAAATGSQLRSVLIKEGASPERARKNVKLKILKAVLVKRLNVGIALLLNAQLRLLLL